MSLFWRVVVTNAAILVLATVVLLVSPATVSFPVALTEALVLLGGLGAMLVLNYVLLRRTFAPLQRLADVARRVDPLRPGARVEVPSSDGEVRDVARAFNDMLDRLERERGDSARRALRAQEDERMRVARELHDEVGQTLTAVVLGVDRAARRASADLRSELEEARETARAGLDEVRDIARRLRPEALDDLGLRSAMTALCAHAERAGVAIERDIEGDLRSLSPEAELVIYRVAQEALTNVARHAHASAASLTLRREGDAVVLRMCDDGCGISEEEVRSSAGIRGMRERAVLAGGVLTVTPRQPRGTEVRLRLPLP